MSEPAERRITLDDTHDGERIDRALAAALADISRSTIQRLIEERRVTLDGHPATRKSRARTGMVVVVRPTPPPPIRAEPEDIPIDVLYEDDVIIVVDKPAGMVVHPAPGHPRGTLVNALLGRGLRGGDDALRPGIVHRIDKDTSGILVVAKDPRAHEALVRMFQAHALDRRYVAIARGGVQSQTFDTLHGRHPKDRKRFSARVVRGKKATTHVRTLAKLQHATLVECRLETGRTHQIRVHLAESGHALLGDTLYGKPAKSGPLRVAESRLGRQALHARTLAFAHPLTDAPLHFESPLPDEMKAAIVALGGDASSVGT